MKQPNLHPLLTLICSIWLAIGAGTTHAADDPKKPTAIPVPALISDEAQAYYRSLRPRPPSSVDYNDPKAMANLRRGLNTMFLRNAERLGVEYELEPATVDGIEAYWVRTADVKHDEKVIIYLHGGGYILGSAKTNLGLPLRVAADTGIPVVSVEYRLAPEHPFPDGLDDAIGTYRWLLANGYDAEDVAVFGDSAGGGLALAMVLGAREQGLPLPSSLAVLSPLTDLTARGDSRVTLANYDPILTSGGANRYEVYAGEHEVTHPLVSPAFADLSGLPPLLIQVGTREVLLSDSVRLARQAREAGVDVTLDVWDGMWHVWQDHPDAPEARQAAIELGRFLSTHLGLETGT